MGRLLGDRYRVLSRLGEGGMGTVYLCEHAALGRRFAVKVLPPELARDAERAERFRNEAIAASRIGQENVVEVLDLGADEEGALYYVMEALEGRSLGAVIREEGPLAPDRALDLLEQICRALAAAHARGVVHRDVKPENVFVVRREDGSERAKVIDFGVSHLPPGGTSGDAPAQAGAIVGTPGYMAPEQAAGEPVDARADVYAAGVLAYEMLTGTLPIVAETPTGTILAQRTRIPEPPSRRRPELPREVDELVLRALAKRREDRHRSMEALAIAAARVRGAAAERQARPRRRSGNARVAALAAVAMVAASAAAGWWWRTATPAPTSTSTSTSTTTTTATSTRSVPAAKPRSLLGAPWGAPTTTPTTTSTPTPTRQDVRRRAAARTDPRDAHLEDPYAAGGLKPDPFE